MASFTSSVSDLARVGPVVDMEVGVQTTAAKALQDVGQPVPTPMTISAMIDTGASGCVIQPSVVNGLGLLPVGVTKIHTPSSGPAGVDCLTFAVQFLFPKGIRAEMTAIEAPLHGQSIDALIGRDLLKFGVLVYIGHENQFTLSF